MKRFLAARFDEQHLLCVVPAVPVKTLSHCRKHAFAARVDAVFSAYKVD